MATFGADPTYTRNNPGSQESLSSYSSSTARSAMAASSGEAASQATVDTDYPSSMDMSPRQLASADKGQHTIGYHASQHSQPLSKPEVHQPVTHAQQHRVRTPENQVDASGRHSALTSPMSITTPVNGHKRTASGLVKMVDRGQMSPVDATRSSMPRENSVGSTGSKASEHAANLKDRLAYAMAKVQHGWEHHNIDQVERLAAASLSPRTVISPRHTTSRLPHPTSPRSAGFPSRAIVDQIQHHYAPLHNAAQVMSAPPTRATFDRHSSSGESMSPPTKRRTMQDTVMSSPISPQRSGLGPAADFPRSPYSHNQSPGRIPQSPQRNRPILTPSTPKSHRPATIRTQTQTAAAEQEAMDALLLMGSPSHNGAFRGASGGGGGSEGGASLHSSAAQSPRGRIVAPGQRTYWREDSGGSMSERLIGGGGGRQADILRVRGAVLDQIEAES